MQTAVSDLEVEASEEEVTLYYFRYPVEGGEHFLPVATTRPETILGDTAVAVHPERRALSAPYWADARLCPCSSARYPSSATTSVDMEFGTGALKVTPGHDFNDYELARETQSWRFAEYHEQRRQHECRSGRLRRARTATNVASGSGEIWQRPA